MLAWSFLPEGPARSTAFFAATTGWVLSLAVNLSPFMRFDGYHIMADALAIHNLQPRAFALGKTSMRNKLFGLDDAPPEKFSPWLHKLLVVYSWATWVYRFFLFLGIALLIYHISFKLLGIVLAAVEIVFFLLKPIFGEVREWIKMRDRIVKEGRLWPRGVIVAGLVALLFVPFDSRVHVPAVLGTGMEEQHFASEPAQIVEINTAVHAAVEAGQALMLLSSEDIDHRERLASLRLALVEQRLQRVAGYVQDRAQVAVLRRERATLQKEIDGFAERRKRLVITAERAGTVTHMAADLEPGTWVGTKQRLVHVAGGVGLSARGVVSEQDVSRLALGARGQFIPDDANLDSLDVHLVSVGEGTSAARELKLLASMYGGPVDAEPDPDGSPRTAQAMFPVLFDVSDRPSHMARCPREVRGVIVAEGERISFASRIAKRVVSVVLRETGF